MSHSTTDCLVFDLETQRDAMSVGGWKNIHAMRMSVGVIWDSAENKFFAYLEDKIEEMISHLLSGPRIVGFNHIGFDYTVVSGYREDKTERHKLLHRLASQKNLDLMLDLKNRMGYRPKLESVARPTLSVGKSADGLMALKWYAKYKETNDTAHLKKIIHYCVKDVEVTRDVYLFGLKNNYITVDSRNGGIKNVDVDWTESAAEVKQTEQDHLF